MERNIRSQAWPLRLRLLFSGPAFSTHPMKGWRGWLCVCVCVRGLASIRLASVNQPHGCACSGSPCRALHRSRVKTIGMQIKYPGGDFGPLGRRNQPSRVLWLIFVEWDIDLGSTFCKYLPHGRQEGPGTTAERKLFLFKMGRPGSACRWSYAILHYS